MAKNLKKTIILALYKEFETYKTFQRHEDAFDHFVTAEGLEAVRSTMDPGYFKYFFTKVVNEKVFSIPTNRITIDLNKYLAQEAKVAATPAGGRNSVVPAVDNSSIFNDIEIEEWSPVDEIPDTNMFKYFLTNSEMDEIFTDDGGLMSSMATVITGGPGVGKSTVVFWSAARLREYYPTAKIAIISSEMEKDDILYECTRKPWMNTVKFILTSEYNERLMDAIQQIYTGLYDFIFLDSFADVVDKLKDFCGYTGSKAENMLINAMKRAKSGISLDANGKIIYKPNNPKQLEALLAEHGPIEWKYTSTAAIQQVTKGGTFAGSNKLKHNTTAMLELRRESSGDRYMVFTKNRRCGQHVGKKLYYYLGANQQIMFDADRWAREKAGDTEEDETNTAQEGMTNQLLSQFGEISADSVARARALLQQDNLPADLLEQLAAPTENGSQNLELPEGVTLDNIYYDETLNFHVLELGEGITPIFGSTREEVVARLIDRMNEPSDLEPSDLEPSEQPA